MNGEEILNGNYHNFLSMENTDVGMDLDLDGDHHHYGGIDVKEKGMRIFGHHDGDGTKEKMAHGCEILNGDNGEFQSRENVYVRMGCHGDYEILNEDDGGDDFLNVEHVDLLFGDDGVKEKVKDCDGNADFQYVKNDLSFGEFYVGSEGRLKESVTMNYGDHLPGSDYDCYVVEGMVRESGSFVYSFLHSW